MNLSIENVDLANGLLDIYVDTDEEIAGFQFELMGINLTGASGGLAGGNDFMLSTSATTVLGFSITGTFVPAGSQGILVQVSFSDYTGDEICFGIDPVNNVVANIFGNVFEVYILTGTVSHSFPNSLYFPTTLIFNPMTGHGGLIL